MRVPYRLALVPQIPLLAVFALLAVIAVVPVFAVLAVVSVVAALAPGPVVAALSLLVVFAAPFSRCNGASSFLLLALVAFVAILRLVHLKQYSL